MPRRGASASSRAPSEGCSVDAAARGGRHVHVQPPPPPPPAVVNGRTARFGSPITAPSALRSPTHGPDVAPRPEGKRRGATPGRDAKVDVGRRRDAKGRKAHDAPSAVLATCTPGAALRCASVADSRWVAASLAPAGGLQPLTYAELQDAHVAPRMISRSSRARWASQQAVSPGTRGQPHSPPRVAF